MKSIIAIALAGFVAAVSAQGLSDLPQCAFKCLTDGLAATGCSITDIACACNKPSFITDSKTCIDGACQPADQQKALAVAQGLCKQAGVTITVPSTGGSTSSAVASSSSASTSSVASTSSAASTTSAPTSSASSAAPTTGGSTESFPSISQSSTVITSTLTTSAIVTLPSGNVTSNSTSPPLQTTNAAGRLSGMSGAVVLGLGLVAAFAI